MPILAYFVIVGAALLAFFNVVSFGLSDIGSPIKTSRLVGLPKIEPRPYPEPLMTTFNFGAEKRASDTQSLDAIYAKDASAVKTRLRPASNDVGAPREHRVDVYSHDIMMSIH